MALPSPGRLGPRVIFVRRTLESRGPPERASDDLRIGGRLKAVQAIAERARHMRRQNVSPFTNVE